MKKVKVILVSKKSKLLNFLETKNFDLILKEISSVTRKYMLKPTNYDRSAITPYNNEVSDQYKLSHYINASFVTNNYVAFQFPKQEFLPQFFEFIKKSNCKLIISLFDCKKEDYFDEKSLIGRKNKSLDDKIIFYDEIYQINGLKIRRLRYLCWEDFLKPKKNEFLFFFNYFLKIEFPEKVFVHCKMGVGRTGTFIMYDVLNTMKGLDKECFIEVLISLRCQRSDLVYSESQLEFLYSLFFDL